MEADEVAIPEAAKRLRSAVAQLPGHDYPSALHEVNAALRLVIISNAPPDRLGWRFGTNAYFLRKPVLPRILVPHSFSGRLGNDNPEINVVKVDQVIKNFFFNVFKS